MFIRYEVLGIWNNGSKSKENEKHLSAVSPQWATYMNSGRANVANLYQLYTLIEKYKILFKG